jgi:hypothetical protein
MKTRQFKTGRTRQDFFMTARKGLAGAALGAFALGGDPTEVLTKKKGPKKKMPHLIF